MIFTKSIALLDSFADFVLESVADVFSFTELVLALYAAVLPPLEELLEEPPEDELPELDELSLFQGFRPVPENPVLKAFASGDRSLRLPCA